MPLIDNLKRLQGGRSQEEFAEEIGIAQATLSRIYSGDRGIGRQVGRKIARRFPELTFEVAAFFMASDIPEEQNPIPAHQEGAA